MILAVLASVTPEEIQACGPDGSAACLSVYRSTHNELAAKAADWFVAKPLTIGVIVLVAWLVTRFLTRSIRRFVVRIEATAVSETHARVVQRAETIGLVLRSTVRAIVAVIAGATILGELGINLGPLVAGAGIAGIALGFGAQSLVKDFLSGMFMLMEDQFGVGDIIDVGEASGTVEAVSLRTTRLRSVDGTLWHVPNGEIRRVGNQSQHWSRALIDVEVAYDTDLDHAQAVIASVAHDVAAADADVLDEPEVWGVEALGANGVMIRLVVKTRPSQQYRVSRELRARLKTAFEREAI